MISIGWTGFRRRPPLGVWIFTIAYSLVALLALLILARQFPAAHASMDYVNPWQSNWGVILSILSFAVVVSAVGTFVGSRISRAGLTILLALLLGIVLAEEIRGLGQLRGCQSNFTCALREWWRYSLFLGWIPWFAWYALHCWYFFGPRTRDYYAKDA